MAKQRNKHSAARKRLLKKKVKSLQLHGPLRVRA